MPTDKVTPGQTPGIDLEALFDQYRHVVEKLENNPSLEESVKLYEDGMKISAQIKTELDRAERLCVEEIKPDGTIVPYDVKPTR